MVYHATVVCHWCHCCAELSHVYMVLEKYYPLHIIQILVIQICVWMQIFEWVRYLDEFESIIPYIFTVNVMPPANVAVKLSRVSMFITSVLLMLMNYRIYYVNVWCLWMMPCHLIFHSASVCLLCAIIASSIVCYFIIIMEEMETFRLWSLLLRWDPNDVTHCRILPTDKTTRWLV